MFKTIRRVTILAPTGVRNLSLSAATLEKIGFIGLGNMGGGMACNLIKKGNSVLAFDVVDSNLQAVVSQGGVAASSPSAVAAECSKAGELALLMFTMIRYLLNKNNKCPMKYAIGVEFVDAPVSGGVNAASAGTLTFMVGAETEQNFTIAHQTLQHMGAKIIHCGGVGTGGAVKICNNMLLAVSMIGTSEAMNLGIQLGLDPKLLADILGSATGRCWSVDTYNPCPGVLPNVPSSNDYKGGFGTALMTKDLGLAQDAATRAGAATPLGSLAHQIYRTMCNNGFAEKDFSSAFKFIQKK